MKRILLLAMLTDCTITNTMEQNNDKFFNNPMMQTLNTINNEIAELQYENIFLKKQLADAEKYKKKYLLLLSCAPSIIAVGIYFGHWYTNKR